MRESESVAMVVEMEVTMAWKWSYARRVGAVALVADGTLSSDIAVGISIGGGVDIASAAAAVGGDWIRHRCSALSSKICVT